MATAAASIGAVGIGAVPTQPAAIAGAAPPQPAVVASPTQFTVPGTARPGSQPGASSTHPEQSASRELRGEVEDKDGVAGATGANGGLSPSTPLATLNGVAPAATAGVAVSATAPARTTLHGANATKHSMPIVRAHSDNIVAATRSSATRAERHRRMAALYERLAYLHREEAAECMPPEESAYADEAEQAGLVQY
jgi:hypothetical protein